MITVTSGAGSQVPPAAAAGVTEAAGFRHMVEIHFDELDPMRMLHNSRYAVYAERALNAFFWSVGREYAADVTENPDQFHVVKEISVEFLEPFLGTGQMATVIWAERIGTSSCVHGFVCLSPVSSRVHARGRRTIVKLDPATLRPARWTEWFRAVHERLLLKAGTGDGGA